LLVASLAGRLAVRSTSRRRFAVAGYLFSHRAIGLDAKTGRRSGYIKLARRMW
jgi:hypothetical protein